MLKGDRLEIWAGGLLHTHHSTGVPLDKSEGTVKGKDILGSVEALHTLPERLRTKTLEISRGITLRWNRSFHQPSIRPRLQP